MFKKIVTVLLISTIVFSLSGCGESFRKKFISKPKYEPKEEKMVIAPKDYSKQDLPSDELYKMYYAYWKAWHLELMDMFVQGESRKRIISCFDQTILNLDRLKQLLTNQEKTTLMDSYIDKLATLEDKFRAENIAMISMSRMRDESRRLFINIQKDFSFSKVQKYLK